MDALQQLARYLSAIQGRKNLIWFSGSFPIPFDRNPNRPLPFLAVRNYEDEIRKTRQFLTAARAADAGIACGKSVAARDGGEPDSRKGQIARGSFGSAVGVGGPASDLDSQNGFSFHLSVTSVTRAGMV